MMFSIVVPVYNQINYIEECLISLVGQEGRNEYEIILVDDGSSDGSEKVCDRYYEKYPELITVYHNTNHGLLYSRRYGYNHSNGKYIVNCDSDDTLERNALLELSRIISSENPDVIIFNMNSYDGKIKKLHTYSIFDIPSEKWGIISSSDVYSEFVQSTRIVSLCTKIYKKSSIDCDDLYLEYGKFNNGEDSLQSIEIYKKSHKYIYLNKALYNYRIQLGMTAKFDIHYMDTFLVIIKKIIENKESWKIEQFDKRIRIKILCILGRAITQLRYSQDMNIETKKKYLRSLYNNQVVQECIKNKYYIKIYDIPIHYKLLIALLMKEQYILILILLYIKNIFYSGKK